MWRKFKRLGVIGIVGGCAIAGAPASAAQGLGLVAGTATGGTFAQPALALVIPSSTSATLYDLSTSLQALPGWAFSSGAHACALNSLGSIGLVGGENISGNGTLALVIPSSTSAALFDLSASLKALSGWGNTSVVNACTLNGTGSLGLVAGAGKSQNDPALALVIPSSTSAALFDLSTSLTALSGWGTTGQANACTLNSTGSIGLVAGLGLIRASAALALVIPSSTSAALFDLSASLKALSGWGNSSDALACALNSSGSIGLVGGYGLSGGFPALALVIPSSTSAAFFDLSTSLKTLPGWASDGEALACALNSSGSIGLVAGSGQNNTAPALTLVIPSSTSAALYDLSASLIALSGWGSSGKVYGCALNSTGSVGLVAGQGQGNSAAALALVITSSTSAALYDLSASLTALPGWGSSSIANACALSSLLCSLLSSLTPTTTGTDTSSVLYDGEALAYALSSLLSSLAFATTETYTSSVLYDDDGIERHASTSELRADENTGT